MTQETKVTQADREAAWLIELGSSEPCEPRYWGGSKGWTSDHQEAVRYCREIDAFRAAEAMSAGAPDEYRVCEHIWQDTRNEQSGQTEAELLREVLESIQRHAACPVGHPKALEFIAEEARQALAKSESEYDRLASTEAADALLRECYEPMMLLAQSDKNPQTRKIAAMLAARIDTHLKGASHDNQD